MKKLTLIAALLATTLGAVGTAQAGGYGQNEVSIQAIPAHANVVVVDARAARNAHRMHNNYREQMARAAHHQRKAQNTVKIIVVKPAPHVKKKVVYVKPRPVVVQKVVYVQQPSRHRYHQRPGTVVDRVENRVAVTNAAPVRSHYHY